MNLAAKQNMWIFNHYATTPEDMGTRTYDLANELVSRGHQVTVFASSFSHYKFRDDILASGEKHRIEDIDGIRFVWLRTFPYTANNWRRVVNILTYGWRAFTTACSLEDRPSVVMGKMFHPIAVIVAYLIARKKRCRFFFEVGDLWPETMVDRGRVSRKSPIVLVLKILERYLYRKADKIVSLLPYAHEYITSLGVPMGKIVWIPNGVVPSRYSSIAPYRRRGNSPFTVMFLGAFVKSNAIDVILEAAKILQDRNVASIHFVFVGDGQEKQMLVALANNLALKNVEFWPGVPKKEVSVVMSEADAFLFALRDLPIYRYGMSLSKCFDYLISGRPIIFSGNPRCNYVEEARAGFNVPPEDEHALADAINRLATASFEERAAMGERGRTYVRENFTWKILADRFEEAIYL